MNQSINTDSKNSKEPQQKYRLGTVSIKILGGLNRFYRRLTSPSASIMAQNIQLFGPRGGFLTHQWIITWTYSCKLCQWGKGTTLSKQSVTLLTKIQKKKKKKIVLYSDMTNNRLFEWFYSVSVEYRFWFSRYQASDRTFWTILMQIYWATGLLFKFEKINPSFLNIRKCQPKSYYPLFVPC